MGVDWLTATACERDTCIGMADMGASLVRSETSKGYDLRPWRMAGFEGWKAGACQFGRRNDEVIMRLSDYLAHREWRNLYAVANNTSRVDVECTSRSACSAAKRVRGFAAEGYKHATGRQAKYHVTYICGNDGSATCYLGRRSSERYGRIYTKGVESGLDQWANTVRFELELKDRAAKQAIAFLALHDGPDVPYAAVLQPFFRGRGISCRFPVACSSYEYDSSRTSDRARRLEWVKKCLGPFSRELVESGDGPTLLDCLGLDIAGGELIVKRTST